MIRRGYLRDVAAVEGDYGVILINKPTKQWRKSIYLNNNELYPLQLVLRSIVLQSTENAIVADADGADVMIFRPLIKYATIMVSIIPMMIIYPFVQKYFVSGVMIGAVKG